eukprot:3109834-Rhodomonas_salina.2
METLCGSAAGDVCAQVDSVIDGVELQIIFFRCPSADDAILFSSGLSCSCGSWSKSAQRVRQLCGEANLLEMVQGARGVGTRWSGRLLGDSCGGGCAASSGHGRGGVGGEWEIAPQLPFFFSNCPLRPTVERTRVKNRKFESTDRKSWKK